MPKFCQFLLIFLCLGPTVNGQSKEHSAILGDLRVTVTAVREATADDVKQYRLYSNPGYHSVLVFLKVKNVADYPNCTFPTYWLGVAQGYQYKGASLSGKNALKAFRLPPSDESEGILDFQVKDGTKPVTLKILRDDTTDAFCAQEQHRERRNTGPTTVRLSLQGLPNKNG